MPSKKKNVTKQSILPISELITPKPSRKGNVAPPLKEAGATRPGVHPATPLMKKVAEKSYSPKVANKVFSAEDIQDILRRKQNHLQVEPEERVALREQYRKIKRQVKDLEKGNQSRVIVFPSLVNGVGWYKAIQFSALYYAYRLADRMGRHARVLKDSDRFSKADFSVSITDIDRFVKQFKNLEDPRLEITEEGVYIFTLKQPVSDDEVGALRRTEETRRERMHNILRPKEMDPASYSAILMIVRQLVPRIKKLPPPYFTAVGCRITNDISDLLSLYGQFADGLYSRKDVGPKLLTSIDDVIACLTVLAENLVWPYDVTAIIGENANEDKRRICKDFNVSSGIDKSG